MTASEIRIPGTSLRASLTLPITASGQTLGEAQTHFDPDCDNTAQVIKESAGQLVALEVSNPNNQDAYLQLFDLAAGDVVVGTTTPKLSLIVPGSGAMDKNFSPGLGFGTAITYACTNTAAGSGDPITGLVVNAAFI